jgi:hypothetical protein
VDRCILNVCSFLFNVAPSARKQAK